MAETKQFPSGRQIESIPLLLFYEHFAECEKRWAERGENSVRREFRGRWERKGVQASGWGCAFRAGKSQGSSTPAPQAPADVCAPPQLLQPATCMASAHPRPPPARGAGPTYTAKCPATWTWGPGQEHRGSGGWASEQGTGTSTAVTTTHLSRKLGSHTIWGPLVSTLGNEGLEGIISMSLSVLPSNIPASVVPLPRTNMQPRTSQPRGRERLCRLSTPPPCLGLLGPHLPPRGWASSGGEELLRPGIHPGCPTATLFLF